MGSAWYAPVLLVLVCLFLPIAAMPLQSLWLDETVGVYINRSGSDSFMAFLKAFPPGDGSHAFTLFHTVLGELWVLAVPKTEFWLRISNLPFLVGVAWLLWRWVRELHLAVPFPAVLFCLVVGLSPFWMYYAIEFRPYAALIFFGGLLHYGLCRFETGARGGSFLVALAFALAFLCQPMTIFVVPVLGVGLFPMARRDGVSFLRRMGWPAATVAPLVVAMGFYNVWVSRLGKMVTFGNAPDLKNFLYVLYEFGGFAGLGPPRELLREVNPLVSDPGVFFQGFAPIHVILCACLGAAWVWAGWSCIQWRRTFAAESDFSRTALKWSCLLVFGSGAAMTAYFHWKSYRYLPRHFGLLFFPFMLGVAILLIRIRNSVSCTARSGSPRLGRGSSWLSNPVWLLALLFGVSSFRLAFLPAYGRDDYRAFFRWAESEIHRDPHTRIWCASTIFPALVYWTEPSFLVARAGVTLRVERVGRSAFREMRLPLEALTSADPHGLILLLEPSEAQWRALAQVAAGRRVLVALNRGVDNDATGGIRKRLRESGDLEPVEKFRFIKVYQWHGVSTAVESGGRKMDKDAIPLW